MSRTAILITAAALVFLIAVAAALQHLGDAGNREVVNQYRGGMFSFTYPLGFEIEEYPNGSIAIGSTTAVGFDSVVNLNILKSPSADPSDNVTAPLDEQILALCATDGPSERISCGSVDRIERVMTKSGEQAQAYYLTLTRERTGSEPEIMTVGPLYAYILSLPEGDGASYALLVVHNPIPALLAGAPDIALLTRINDSVTIGPSTR